MRVAAKARTKGLPRHPRSSSGNSHVHAPQETIRAQNLSLPVCPGVSGGTFNAEGYSFVNFSAEEVLADLRAFLLEARARRPALRVVVTVSPVPSAATAEPRHVWTATSYSKAVLRVAAEAIAKESNTASFPSFEVITSPCSGPLPPGTPIGGYIRRERGV